MDWEDLITTVGPRSFLFFIVADVGAPGPEGPHRPLAVTYRQGRGPGPGRDIENEWGRVRQVVLDCARAIDILTCPANRAAIEAERSLAAAEYRGRHRPEPQRVQVPDLPQPSLTDPVFRYGRPDGPEQTAPPESPPWVDAGAIREFPFISSCLHLALNRMDDDKRPGAQLDDIQERSLATVFRDDALEYGAVVIDISDLDDVRYGIVGSEISYFPATEAMVTGPMFWDRGESKYSGPPPVLYFDNSGSRTPLSAAAYVTKFGMHEVPDGLERLKQHGIVEPRVLGCKPLRTPKHNDCDMLTTRKIYGHPPRKGAATTAPRLSPLATMMPLSRRQSPPFSTPRWLISKPIVNPSSCPASRLVSESDFSRIPRICGLPVHQHSFSGLLMLDAGT